VYSTPPFSFVVSDSELDFVFVNQPPSNMHICPGGKIDLMVSYAGKIDPTRSYWEKDGKPYLLPNGQPERSRFLTISNINVINAGEYRYVAVDTIIRLEDGKYVTYNDNVTYSEACRVSVLPGLEIYYVSQSLNYVIPGRTTGFIVYSSFTSGVENPDNNNSIGFQWYRQNAIGSSVPINDNYYFKGSRSNNLVITEAPDPSVPGAENIYTFNGAFYYVEIIGACGKVDSKKFPIYLHPGQGAEFIKNNTDTYVCKYNDDNIVTFEVEVITPHMDLLKYQWYINDVKALDDDKIDGSTTAKLTIKNPILETQTYCKISAFVNNYYIDLISDTAEVLPIDLTLIAKGPAYDTIIPDLFDGYLRMNIHTDDPGSEFIYRIDAYADWGQSIRFYDTIYARGSTGSSNTKTFEYRITETELKQIVEQFGNCCTLEASVVDGCAPGNNIVNAYWIIDTIDSDDRDVFTTCINDNASFKDLLLTPNPTNDIINISFNSELATSTSIELCGLAGNTITALFEGTSIIGNNKFSFDLSKLGIPSGTYILTIANKMGFTTKQFVFIR